MGTFREQLRHAQYDEIHISPHMDDTAYSCAGRILQRRREGARILVINVFGNGKSDSESSGSGTFSDYEKRMVEEEAVMTRLDVDFIWLNYPELLFRKNGVGDLVRFLVPFMRLAGNTHDDLFESLLTLLTRYLAAGGEVLFPFSVGFHPDHRVLFDVGRALHVLGRFRISFYEDIPYATVPALCTLRLRYLGAERSLGLFSATSDVNFFLFHNFGGWRHLTWLPVFLYLSSLAVLHALSRGVDSLSGEPLPEPSVRAIDDVIAQKADVMRLYPTQTAFFMTLGPALVEMIKLDGKAEERSWRFPAFASSAARLSARQKQAVAALPSAGAENRQATGTHP